MRLRDYQVEAIEAAEAHLAEGHSPIVEVPCGGGKSAISAALALNGGRSLILAHRAELLEQTARLLPRATLACAGLGPVDFSGRIVIASRDTAGSRLAKLPRFDRIVADEAHSVGRRSEGGVIRASSRASGSSIRTSASSASPRRRGARAKGISSGSARSTLSPTRSRSGRSSIAGSSRRSGPISRPMGRSTRRAS